MSSETEELCTNLIKRLKERLNSLDFLERHRQSEQAFIRQRCLPFVTVVVFLLYHHRWPVEENYKVMKYRVEVESWSGKSKLAIYQDFHAKVFTTNLTAILAHPAQTLVEHQSQAKKYTYQVNFTHLLSKMKDTVVLLFQQPVISTLLDRLWQIMTHIIEPIRPNRKYPRKKSIKPKRFAMTYKPTR
ncbi:MAG: hypothetical protein DPW09_09420 [Anaerolineae bacterium]|nr:hypothetical protein [Anaerolineales bacterium]MCQ3973648.1 hypothetical protein [Anaerolineae bacterium]